MPQITAPISSSKNLNHTARVHFKSAIRDVCAHRFSISTHVLKPDDVLAVDMRPLLPSPASLPRICLLVYVASSVAKYRRGQVTVAGKEVELEAFRFPSVAVCGGLSRFAPIDENESWVDVVLHDVAPGDGDASLVREV